MTFFVLLVYIIVICFFFSGYYADPENCRWFFACLDHGKSGLTAYEFRCPFGLLFDESRLLCEWPWLVPSCASGHGLGLELESLEFYGGLAGSSASITHAADAGLQSKNNLVHIFDTYDGLGSLGAVQLGGYHGDLSSFGKLHGYTGESSAALNLDSAQLGINGFNGGSYNGAGINLGLSGAHLAQSGLDNIHLGNAAVQLDSTLAGVDGLASSNLGLNLEKGSLLHGTGSANVNSGLNLEGSVLLNSHGFDRQNIEGNTASLLLANNGNVDHNANVEYHGNFGLKTAGHVVAVDSDASNKYGLEQAAILQQSGNKFNLYDNFQDNVKNYEQVSVLGSLSNSQNIGQGFLKTTANAGTAGFKNNYYGFEDAFNSANNQQNLNLNAHYYYGNGYGYNGNGYIGSSDFAQYIGNQEVQKLNFNDNSNLYKGVLHYGAVQPAVNTYSYQNADLLHAPVSVVQKEKINTYVQPSGNIQYNEFVNSNLNNQHATSSQHFTQTHSNAQSVYNLKDDLSKQRHNLPVITYGTVNPAFYSNLSYASQHVFERPKYTPLQTQIYQSPISVTSFENSRPYLFGKQLQNAYQNVYIENKVPLLQQAAFVPKYESTYQGNLGGSYQKVAFKVKTPVLQEQKVFVSPKVETVSVSPVLDAGYVDKVESVTITPSYQTQYESNAGHSFQNIAIETKAPIVQQKQVLLTPKVEAVSTGYSTIYENQGASFQNINTQPHTILQPQVVVSPKVESVSTVAPSVVFETKPVLQLQKQVHLAPKQETLLVTPSYETQGATGQSYQNVVFETKAPIVKQKQVYIAPNIETVTVAPKVETVSVTPVYDNYYLSNLGQKQGQSFQSVTFKTKAQDVFLPQVHVSPKLETVSAVLPQKYEYGHRQVFHDTFVHAKPIFQQKQVYGAPKIETISVAPTYESGAAQSFQSTAFHTKIPTVEQKHVYVAPQVETVSVVPTYENQYKEIGTGQSFQSSSFHTKIPTVEQKLYVAPKIETVSVAPTYETEYKETGTGQSYQSFAFDTKVPAVEQKQVYVAPKIETVSVAPTYESHYIENGAAQNFHSTAFHTKVPTFEQKQVYVAPKLETVSVAPTYEIYKNAEQSFISFKPKVAVQQQQVYVAPQLETVAKTYETAYGQHGSSYQSINFENKYKNIQPQVYVAPKLETVSVTPKYETYYETQSVQTPIVRQQIHLQPQIQTVTVTPKYESNSYDKLSFQQINIPIKQEQVYVPKVETVTVAPKYKTEFYGQSNVQVQHIPTLQQEQVYIKSNAETVTPLPNYETNYNYGTRYQTASFAQKTPLVLNQVYTQPKVETVSVTPTYESHYIAKQEIRQPVLTQKLTPIPTARYETHFETPKVQTTYYEKNIQPVVPLQTVTPVTKLIQSQQYVPQKTVLNVKQQSYEYIPPQIPQTVHVSSQSNSYATFNTQKDNLQQHVPVKTVTKPVVYETYSIQPQRTVVTNIKSSPIKETVYLPTYKAPAPKIQVTTPRYDIYEEYSQPKYQTFVSATQKPLITPTISNVYVTTAKPYVAPKVSYISTTPKYNVFAEVVKPKQVIIQTTPKPYIPQNIQQYYYTSSLPKYSQNEANLFVSSPRPFTTKYENVVSTTPKYNVFQEYVAPKQTLVANVVKPTQFTEFKYEDATYTKNSNYNAKQVYTVEQSKQKINTNNEFDVFSYYDNYNQNNQGVKYSNIYEEVQQPKVVQEAIYYSTERPIVSTAAANGAKFTETVYKNVKIPVVTEQPAYYIPQKPRLSTEAYIPLKNYETEYILSTPKPTFVSTIAPVIKQTARLPTKVVAVNKYIITTPAPIRVTASTPVLKTSKALAGLTFYDNRFTSTRRPTFKQYVADYVTTSAPEILPTSFRPIIPRRKIVTTTAVPIIYSTTEAPQQYLKETTYEKYSTPIVVTTLKPKPTVRPVVIKKKLLTTTAVLVEYYDTSYVTSEKVASQFEQYLKEVTDIKNSEEFDSAYIVTTPRPKITVRPTIRKKILTTTTAPYTERYILSTERGTVKITPKPKAKTIVRVNDFHPFLTSKLGAQCTCRSNTLHLRKKSKQIIEVPDEDYDSPSVRKLTSKGPAAYDDYSEPGVYVVDNNDDDYYEDDDYEVKKVTVTTTPKVVISTTNAVQPAPTPVYTIRQKPATPIVKVEVTSITPRPRAKYVSTTPAREVFLKNSRKNDNVKVEKIAKAVKEGLTLVKSAIKGYVKEAIDEKVEEFDRFGPGGLRGRGETLQGTVDCQREGLFRHPTQCNKFYACHWDCKKQKYTLHVFNCPVHLTFDNTMGACNWPSKGPACSENTLLPSV